MAGEARKELHKTVKDLFDTGKYTDLIITCGDDTHKVHKAIICSQSGFFERAERFPAGAEQVKDTVDLPEDEPDLVKKYIQFLYEAEYDPRLPDDDTSPGITAKPTVTATKVDGYSYDFPHTCSPEQDRQNICPHHRCKWNSRITRAADFVCEHCCADHGKLLMCPPGDANQLLLHAQMYELGEKYDTPSLKSLAQEKFRRACDVFWDDDVFARAAHHAYSTTPDSDMGLRDIVIQKIAENLALTHKPAIEAVMTEFNGLAVGVLKIRAKDSTSESAKQTSISIRETARCPNCGDFW